MFALMTHYNHDDDKCTYRVISNAFRTGSDRTHKTRRFDGYTVYRSRLSTIRIFLVVTLKLFLSKEIFFTLFVNSIREISLKR